MRKIIDFIKDHPIIFNLIGAIIAGYFVLWLIGVGFLGIWTNHGDTVTVPQVKGMNVDVAKAALQRGGFVIELDSIYDKTHAAGTVIDQSPQEGSKVKQGRKIYLRYICYNPRLVKIPDYTGMSRRQAKVSFESLGLTNITFSDIPSDTPDLVLGVTYNGQPLQPGKQIPETAKIIIMVGAVTEEYTESENIDAESEELILPEDEDALFIESLGLNDD